MWHFLRLILFAGIRCINSSTGYWMDGHYVNHVCMYSKTYLCICVSAILCICMNASCIFVQTLIPFAAVRHMSPDRVKTPLPQPPRHYVIHAIFQWTLYLLAFKCCNTPQDRPIYVAIHHITVPKCSGSKEETVCLPKTQNLPKFPTCDRHRWEEGDVCAMLRRAKAD